MLATSCYDLDGYHIIGYRGVVCGAAVRTPTITEHFFGRLKYMLGGQITSFKQMSRNAHQEAYVDMLARAKQLGANAVVRVRYETSMIVPRLSASEVVCYGTAVVVERANEEVNLKPVRAA